MNEKVKDNLSRTGKQFYTWGTLGSFSGSAAAVVIVWTALKRMAPSHLSTELVPFVISLVLIGALAFFTEPPKEEEQTTWRQKGQKIVITILNSFMVYLSAVGFHQWYTP